MPWPNHSKDLFRASLTDAEFAESYGLKDNRDWKLAEARKALRSEPDWEEGLTRCAYRPFDERWGYYSEAAMDYPRRELIQNVAGHKNISMLLPRQIGTGNWLHAMATNVVPESCVISTKTKEQNYCFPLWLYPSAKSDLLDVASPEKTANFAPDFLDDLNAKLGSAPVPEVILAYIYAVLYAPYYRSRYAAFLKRDFPRVPLPLDRAMFDRLVRLGSELIAIHIMENTRPHITKYPIPGNDRVEKTRYTEPTDKQPGRVYINSEQYFEGVPAVVWDYHIGGYRVAEKWLKDRKGRTLSYDDLTHYQNVIVALDRTIAIQAEIDAAIATAGGWPLK